MEEEGEEEEKTTTATATEMTANYYGKEVLKLMRRKMSGGGEGTKMAQGGGTEGIPKSASSSSLLPCPPMLFSLEDELFMAPSTFDDGMMEEAGCHHHFVGRQWLFKELCQQLIMERAKLVLLVGQSGCGKSAIVQQLVAASPFWARQKVPK
jgi:ATP-dependent Clp protease ATP-binding subunit ClpA